MRRPAGALARRDAVEVVEVDAVGALLDADQPRLHVAERRDGAGVGRQLDEHDVAGIGEHARRQVERLLRSAS